MIKAMFAKGTTEAEFNLFIYHCKRTGLNPLAKQCWAVKRWDASQNRETMALQTGIDGFRLIAERSGKYAGQLGPFWCGADGIWKDVWLDKSVPPVAAKVGILRRDFTEPCWGVARYDAYVGKKKDGSPTQFWIKMGDVMTAKCAEALGMRKAFPQELSGVYTDDEMQQAAAQEVRESVDTKVDVPHDPQTGEVIEEDPYHRPPAAVGTKAAPRPYAIQVTAEGKIRNYKDFALRFRDCYVAAKDDREKDKWLELNNTELDNMKKDAKKLYARLLELTGIQDTPAGKTA